MADMNQRGRKPADGAANAELPVVNRRIFLGQLVAGVVATAAAAQVPASAKEPPATETVVGFDGVQTRVKSRQAIKGVDVNLTLLGTDEDREVVAAALNQVITKGRLGDNRLTVHTETETGRTASRQEPLPQGCILVAYPGATQDAYGVAFIGKNNRVNHFRLDSQGKIWRDREFEAQFLSSRQVEISLINGRKGLNELESLGLDVQPQLGLVIASDGSRGLIPPGTTSLIVQEGIGLTVKAVDDQGRVLASWRHATKGEPQLEKLSPP